MVKLTKSEAAIIELSTIHDLLTFLKRDIDALGHLSEFMANGRTPSYVLRVAWLARAIARLVTGACQLINGKLPDSHEISELRTLEEAAKTLATEMLRYRETFRGRQMAPEARYTVMCTFQQALRMGHAALLQGHIELAQRLTLLGLADPDPDGKNEPVH